MDILVLDDDPNDVDLISRELRVGGVASQITRVDSESEFVQQLSKSHPDIILSDHNLPRFNGLAALELIREKQLDIPIIFVVGSLSEEMVTRARQLGADDYVLKDRLHELVPAIRRAIKSKQSHDNSPGAQRPSRQDSSVDNLVFRRAVEQCKEAVVITTADLDLPGPQIIYVNEAFTRMTGYPLAEVIGKTPRLLQGPKTERAVLDRLRAQLSRGEFFEGETVNYRKDGTEFILQWEISPMRNPSGETTHFVSVQRDVTERRRAVEDRIESERWRVEREVAQALAQQTIEVLNRVTDAFLSVDRDWRFIYVNREAERLLRKSRTQLIGRNIWEEFPEAVGSDFEQQYQRAVSEQVTVKFESFYTPLQVWLYVSAYPSPEGLSVYFHDITERKRAEESLRASEEFSRSIIESSSDCIKILDVQGRLLSMTKNGQELMEISDLKPYLGQLWVDFWKNDHYEDAGRAMAAALNGNTGRFQGFCRTMAGTPKYWDVICTPIFGRDGKPERVLSVSRDITDLKQAEEQRRTYEERFRLIIEAAKDYAIYMLDCEGNVASWNEGAQRIEGYKAEEIIGKNVAIFFPEEEQKQGRPAEVLFLAKKEGRFEEENWRLRKNGEIYWAGVTITAIYDSERKLCGFSKILRDISVYKRAREEIQRLNTELEERVQVRTAELLAANEQLEAFSYSISHDLRAPLRHIIAFSELLEETAAPKLNPEESHVLKMIGTSASKMSALINDLLSFSRIVGADFVNAPLALREIVDEVIESLAFEIGNRKVQWLIRDLPIVHGDSNMLRQVFANLISNAVKYTRPRDLAQIEIGHQSNKTDHVIYVRDNGVGFDMKHLHKLFGVFQRLHHDSEFEGTGIGLANVRRIVERHGGRVWAESKTGEGATFYFSIPKR
ncbi:MAG: PAS domain S-box protein [Verrucomicrobia bacterium]|nr:PAS domain S-box protein [Verrucomicrobiota bacterium]